MADDKQNDPQRNVRLMDTDDAPFGLDQTNGKLNVNADIGDVSLSVGDIATELIDENGTHYGIKHINNKPRVSSMPYLFDIAEGNVSGHSAWSKIGFNPAVTSSEETIWNGGTDYVFPTGEMQLEVVSTDNINDKNGGNGALTIRINYLNAALAEKSETVTLNGTVAVPTLASDIFRVQNVRVASTGSSGKAAGTISVRHLNDTPIYSQIAVGQTRARNATYTVPAGKVLYITSFSAGGISTAINKYVRFFFRATYDDKIDALLTAGVFFMPYIEIMLQDAFVTREFECPLKFPAGTDIKVNAMSDGTSAVQCAIRGWQETV